MADTAEKFRPLSEEEKNKAAAEARRADAQAKQAEAETRMFLAQAMTAEAQAQESEIELARTRHKREKELSQDEYHKVYRFHGVVREESVKACISALSTWNRTSPQCDITLVLNSPGGGVIEGFALWDFLAELKSSGHKLTTIARGYAASMGGVLLQAGDTRIMGETASLLIHEAQFGVYGSFGEIVDEVEFVKKLQERILEIFADRSKLTKRQIKSKWHRKNWWMLPDEALKHGFVDEIGGGGAV